MIQRIMTSFHSSPWPLSEQRNEETSYASQIVLHAQAYKFALQVFLSSRHGTLGSMELPVT